MSRLNRRLVERYNAESKLVNRVLVLTTLGRKTGKRRSTPLQYEEVGGIYYVAAARGAKADWYRNLVACPEVEVVVGEKRFITQARPTTDVSEIADFLELRLRKHPYFMAIMMRLEGLPSKHKRVDLEKFAERLAIVALPETRN